MNIRTYRDFRRKVPSVKVQVEILESTAMDSRRMRGTVGILALGVVFLFGLAGQFALAQPGQDDGPPPAVAGGQMVRGTVTAVAPDHITVKTQEGDTVQVVVTPNTRVRKGRDQIKFADIHAGDGAGAMGVLDPATKTVHALVVMVVDAEQLKKAREAMGKTYIAGKITAIDTDALKITVMREDNISQVIGLDDDTSFKRGGRGMGQMMGFGGPGEGGGGGERPNRPNRPAGQGGGQGGGGGESITLADVKVGDTIAGPGTVKAGVFVPTELRVADPAMMGNGGGRRRRPQGGAAPDAGAPPAAAPAEPKA
jgi:hypothetical protein